MRKRDRHRNGQTDSIFEGTGESMGLAVFLAASLLLTAILVTPGAAGTAASEGDELSLIQQLRQGRRLPLDTETRRPAEAIELTTFSETQVQPVKKVAEITAADKIDLLTCIRQALVRSSAIVDVTSRLAEARARLSDSRVDRRIKPTLSASWQESGNDTLTGLGLALKYDLDHDGLIGESVKQYKLDLLRLSLAEGTARNRLVDSVVGIYIDALIARASLKVAKESTASAQGFLERMKKNFALAVVTPLELWQARSFYANEEYREFLAGSQYRQAMGSLNVLTGHDYDRDADLLEIDDISMDTLDPRALVNRAFENRADLKSSKLVLEMNRLSLSMARKNMDLRHSLSASGTDQELTTTLDQTQWKAGVTSTLDTGWSQISANVFRQGGDNGQAEENSASLSLGLNTGNTRVIALESAKGAVKRQEMTIRDLRDSIIESVNSSVETLASSRAKIKYLEIALAAKQEEKRKKQKEYDLGLESAEELLDVSSEVIAAETELVVEKYRLVRRTYQLIRELYAFDSKWSHADQAVSE